MTATINTIATAIAKDNGQDVETIAAVLIDEDSEVGFFQEMDTLASDTHTSIEVLEALKSYCSEQLNEEFAVDADDVHLTIRAKTHGTLNLKTYGTFAVTTRGQVDELDWEVPGIGEFEDADEFEDAVIAAFEKHNDVALEDYAREYFTGAIEDYYRTA
ncbi:hypothetical protein ACWG8W_06060 [Citricoccus zhacaiensis]